jgi:hypothetical protein
LDEPLATARRRAHLRNGNGEISIALAAPPCPTSRGFLHRRLSDAGPPRASRHARDRAGIRNPARKRLCRDRGRMADFHPRPANKRGSLQPDAIGASISQRHRPSHVRLWKFSRPAILPKSLPLPISGGELTPGKRAASQSHTGKETPSRPRHLTRLARCRLLCPTHQRHGDGY